MKKEKKKDGSSGQAYCCPHCADSKFPCVNMERLMRTEKKQDRDQDPDPEEN